MKQKFFEILKPTKNLRQMDLHLKIEDERVGIQNTWGLKTSAVLGCPPG